MKPNWIKEWDTSTTFLLVLLVLLLLSVIKIYVTSHIYYESRHIHRLEQEVAALKEEKTLIAMRVETLQYKSQITDTIFPLEPPTTEEPPYDP